MCLEENKCQLENCEYCGVDINGEEKCERCHEDYAIRLGLDNMTTCQ